MRCSVFSTVDHRGVVSSIVATLSLGFARPTRSRVVPAGDPRVTLAGLERLELSLLANGGDRLRFAVADGQLDGAWRRFVFRPMTAGQAVLPSEHVDQLWHLCLVYTRDNWVVVCKPVLGAPHHCPRRLEAQSRSRGIRCVESSNSGGAPSGFPRTALERPWAAREMPFWRRFGVTLISQTVP